MLGADIPPAVYRALVAAAPDGILLVGSDGSIRFANPEAARIFGYAHADSASGGASADDMIGLSVEALVPAEMRTRHEQHRQDFVAHARKRPMGSGLDLSGQRRDGSRIAVEISLSPIRSDGEALVVAIVRDVSDRRAAQETIQELSDSLAARVGHLEILNAELESFSYSVSHDLRAPLRAIDGFSLALLEDYGDALPTDGKRYLDRVRAAAQRMAQLIDDLLVLSRITRADLERTTVDVTDLAATIMRDLAKQEPERRHAVEVEPDLKLEADPRQLRLVLENLLGNAWKFTAKEPWTHIKVAATTLDGEPAIVVSDNGAGFDEQYADKMFGAFQRLHGLGDYPGTGVGLAIVQRILVRHGGRITARSHPGAGATFVFRTTGPSRSPEWASPGRGSVSSPHGPPEPREPHAAAGMDGTS